MMSDLAIEWREIWTRGARELREREEMRRRLDREAR